MGGPTAGNLLNLIPATRHLTGNDPFHDTMRHPAVAVLIALLTVVAGCNAPTALSSGATTAGALDAADRAPPEHDVVGWENGYWYDSKLSITPGNGLNASEREAVVSRAMARVEKIRHLEFTQSVPVNVTTRAAFRNRTTGGDSGGNAGSDDPARLFDNVEHEALFLVGEHDDSVSASKETTSQTVLGFYSSRTKAIVIVSDSATPRIRDERTLAHELVHALQDQHFDLRYNASTEDGHDARLGLVEGDAMVVEQAYTNRCGSQWQCLGDDGGNDGANGGSTGGGGSTSGPGHMGLYLASIFPYTDGSGFVRSLRARGGWDAVNAAYTDSPVSSEQIIHPKRYPGDRPVTVTIRDSPDAGWQRVRPPGPDYDRLGQALMSTMFMYTLYDSYNRTAVVSPRDVLNVDPSGDVNATDPLNYGLTYTDGWDGDRLLVYRRGTETAYVWKSVWESDRDAAEFAAGYRRLLEHWGGHRVGPNRWVVTDDSQFSDAFELRVRGDTVTIVNAPTAVDLSDVAPGGS
ncbi:MAG: Hvo_1808 family surface protein [Haloarculaceae archaeon]